MVWKSTCLTPTPRHVWQHMYIHSHTKAIPCAASGKKLGRQLWRVAGWERAGRVEPFARVHVGGGAQFNSTTSMYIHIYREYKYIYIYRCMYGKKLYIYIYLYIYQYIYIYIYMYTFVFCASWFRQTGSQTRADAGGPKRKLGGRRSGMLRSTKRNKGTCTRISPYIYVCMCDIFIHTYMETL